MEVAAVYVVHAAAVCLLSVFKMVCAINQRLISTIGHLTAGYHTREKIGTAEVGFTNAA